MLEFDKKSNLLMTNRYQYSLQDVAEPNLYRELYDYESIPKVAFNMRHVPENMPDEIWMTDTTFRDGQQSVSPFTVEQIVHLYSLMHRLGGPKGLIRQSEFFLYTDKDKKALHACQDLGYDFPEITTWIRANEKDFELVKQAGVKETGILVSCSDYHIFKKMHLTRKQAMDKYLGIVKAALDRGIRPRCHFEDITRADFYGFVRGIRAADQDSRLRHDGLRRALLWCCPAALRPRHHLRSAPLRARTVGTAGVARSQRLLQGRQQRGYGVDVRLLVGQLLAAGHRRTHGQLPAGSHGD